jgi:hypothetical protein
MVMVMAEAKLVSLILTVKGDEQRFGCARKDSLLAIAEYMATHYRGLDYSKEEGTSAIILLARYRMANLADRLRGKRLIEAERAKAYVARCMHCGAIISSDKSLKTGLGSECRKKLGMKA